MNELKIVIVLVVRNLKIEVAYEEPDSQSAKRTTKTRGWEEGLSLSKIASVSSSQGKQGLG